jgi:hypothetical protein
MRAKAALWVRPVLVCGVLGFSGLGLTAALADEAACKALGSAMLVNSKTPYHSVGSITFDPKDPPIPGGKGLPAAIATETIFTGTQVFVKLPSGQWKDVHANLADLQSRVKQSAANFNDCTHLPNDKVDGKELAIYTGADKTDTMNVATKVWVAPDTGTLMRSETDIGGPTAPDGKVRHQHLSLRYDYSDIKPPAASN